MTMDRQQIVKELHKLSDEIQSLQKEDETIKQLETTDPGKARKMISAQLNKLIELNKKQETLFAKFKKAKTDYTERGGTWGLTFIFSDS